MRTATAGVLALCRSSRCYTRVVAQCGLQLRGGAARARRGAALRAGTALPVQVPSFLRLLGFAARHDANADREGGLVEETDRLFSWSYCFLLSLRAPGTQASRVLILLTFLRDGHVLTRTSHPRQGTGVRGLVVLASSGCGAAAIPAAYARRALSSSRTRRSSSRGSRPAQRTALSPSGGLLCCWPAVSLYVWLQPEAARGLVAPVAPRPRRLMNPDERLAERAVHPVSVPHRPRRYWPRSRARSCCCSPVL